MCEKYDQGYFIRSVNRRVRIVSVVGDEWVYELITCHADGAEPGDIELKDQPAFDEVLAELHLIKLESGRRFVNRLIRLTRLDHLSPETKPSTQQMRRLDAPRQ